MRGEMSIGKRPAGKNSVYNIYLAIALAISLMGVIYISLVNFVNVSAKSYNTIGMLNINTSEISALLPSWKYKVISINTTYFNSNAYGGNYIALTVLALLGKNVSQYSNLPYSIVSYVFVAKNHSEADALEESYLNATYLNDSLIYLQKYGQYTLNYTYGGHVITFYLKDSSALPNLFIQLHDTAPLPVYQSSVSFVYCNLIAEITVTGYKNLNLSIPLSLSKEMYTTFVEKYPDCTGLPTH